MEPPHFIYDFFLPSQNSNTVLSVCLSAGIEISKAHGAKYRLGPELEIWYENHLVAPRFLFKFDMSIMCSNLKVPFLNVLYNVNILSDHAYFKRPSL